MVKVITYGTFDLLHYGHLRLLERAKALGDYLIVGITSDDFDKARGKINNRQNLMERIAAVKETGLADEIIVEEYEGQKIDDIRKYGVDIFTVGSDWTGHFDYLKAYCEVVYLPRTEGVSSSGVRAERRKLKIGLVGNTAFREKFIREAGFVNGAEVIIPDTANYDELLERVDAVYVLSKPERHYADAKYALEAGKHVLCESPVAYSAEEAKALYGLAEEKQLILMDAIKTAYSTAYGRLILLVKSGRIGDIISVDTVCTSLQDGVGEAGTDLSGKWNSMCAWGPVAMLPVLDIFGTDFKDLSFYTRFVDKAANMDAFTKIDFVYPAGVASVKVAKGAKAEGELIITGTKGYILVPAPWWKTDYFEVRYENPTENKRYFYQLDGEGIRYEIAAFLKAIESNNRIGFVNKSVSIAIATVIDCFNKRKDLTEI
jgi:choline-phosphate cytidylyltransferase